MNNFEIIQQWIDSDEILNHLDDVAEMELTPEILGLMSQVNFPIEDLSINILSKIKILNENLIKSCNRIEFERLQNRKNRIISQNGEINVKIIDVEYPELNNKYFNRNIAMCYHRLGDNVNAYKFFTIAQEQGLDCLDYLKYYESLFNEENFSNVTRIIADALYIYKLNNTSKIQDIQDYVNNVIEKYTYYLQGEIDVGTETNLKDSVSNYLIDCMIGKKIDNCSTYTYLLSSALEGLLKTFYYKPYIIHLEEEYSKNPDNESIQQTYNKMTKKIVKSQNLFDFHFTLGTFYNMSGLDHFLQWIQNNYNENLTRTDWEKFREAISRIMTMWRNPVAHAVYIEEWKFKYLLNEVLLKEDCLLSKIIKNIGYAEYDKTNDKIMDFDKFIEELQDFIKQNGEYPRINSNDETTAKLARRILKIRQSKKGISALKLTGEMIEKLNQINFDWEPKKLNWFDDFFEKLLKYKNTNKNFVNVVNDEEIGAIVQSIRRQYNGISSASLIRRMIDNHLILTDKQINQLVMIGFPLNNEKTDWFSLFYDELIIYKGIHGNFDDVVSDNGIGPTITRIRQAYKGNDKTMLTPEMIDKLNEIGFPWEARYKKIQEDNVSV